MSDSVSTCGVIPEILLAALEIQIHCLATAHDFRIESIMKQSHVMVTLSRCGLVVWDPETKQAYGVFNIMSCMQMDCCMLCYGWQGSKQRSYAASQDHNVYVVVYGYNTKNKSKNKLGSNVIV